MKHSLALRVREILDQQHIMHSLHKIKEDCYIIHWIKISEGPDIEVEDFGTIEARTKLADLPFGDTP